MKTLLLVIMFAHGAIHLMGIAKAYNLAPVKALSLPISKLYGWAWLIAAILFIAAAFMFLSQNEWWWIPSAAAICISQSLVFKFWRDAKFGTIANVIILAATVAGFSVWFFNKSIHHGHESISQLTAIYPNHNTVYENK